MHRIDHVTATLAHLFTRGDQSGGIPATVITPEIMNAFQEEIAGVIEGAGISLNKASNVQLLAAINALIATAVAAGTLLAAIKTVDGAASGLDADLLDGNHATAFQLASGYTAADVLAKLLTVDGAGSGVDVDLLDGQQGSFYQNADNLSAGTLPVARVGDGSILVAKMAANAKFSSFHGGAVSGNVTLPTIAVGEEGTAWYSQTTTSTSYKFPATGTFDWVLMDSVAATQVGLGAAGGATLATYAAAKTVCIKYFRTA